jgi:hypothetical protein
MVAPSLRRLARYGTVLLAGFLAGSRCVSAWASLQQYREWRERDPSGAEASLTFAQVDLAIAGLCLAIAGLVWWLLRPRAHPSA